MKRFAIAVLCLLMLSSFSLAADKETPKADASAAAHKDKKFLLDYLKKTRQDFLNSIKGLREAQWKYKASPEHWSIAETAEHITLSEDFIRGMIQDKVMKSPEATPEQKAKATLPDEEVIAKITDRSKKAKAPEPLKPTNKWANAKEIQAEFNKRRDATVAYAKSTPDSELRNHVSQSPLGDVDGYQFLLFLSAHTKRHTAQIEEVKADPGYPRK
jgi:uncharacterized damage-inducible protein DinB